MKHISTLLKIFNESQKLDIEASNDKIRDMAVMIKCIAACTMMEDKFPHKVNADGSATLEIDGNTFTVPEMFISRYTSIGNKQTEKIPKEETKTLNCLDNIKISDVILDEEPFFFESNKKVEPIPQEHPEFSYPDEEKKKEEIETNFSEALAFLSRSSNDEEEIVQKEEVKKEPEIKEPENDIYSLDVNDFFMDILQIIVNDDTKKVDSLLGVICPFTSNNGEKRFMLKIESDNGPDKLYVKLDDKPLIIKNDLYDLSMDIEVNSGNLEIKAEIESKYDKELNLTVKERKVNGKEHIHITEGSVSVHLFPLIFGRNGAAKYGYCVLDGNKVIASGNSFEKKEPQFKVGDIKYMLEAVWKDSVLYGRVLNIE